MEFLKLKRSLVYSILGLAIILFFFFYAFFRVPANFKANSTIKIESGQSLISTTRSFQQNNIIASSFWLTNLVILFGGEHRVVAGYYFFPTPENLFTVANRITHGDFGITPIKVTIPEGMTTKDISNIYASKFNLFDPEKFYELAKPEEGYLFPETYFFVPTIQPEDVIAKMSNTFNEKTAPLKDEINNSGHSLADIVTMASILEGEATDTVDRRIIAGILWKRINLHIPLQVDASLKYVTGKGSADLTVADLKMDSPYNTYNQTGLPPTPISNPGLDSIEAALNPTETDYLYFLSDKEGQIHYAKTLKEHDANRKKYL